MPSDVFLKINVVDGEAHRVEHQLLKLGTGFDQVSDSFIDLIADAVKLNDVPGRAHEAFIKHDVQTIGLDFLKLGDDFLKLDAVLHKIDDTVLDFVIKFSPGDPPALGDDFLKLDIDLKSTGTDFAALGADFLKLNDPPPPESSNELFLKIADDFVKIDSALGSVGDDFISIGADFIKFGGSLELPAVQHIDEAFLKLGSDTVKIGEDFHELSDAFLKIALDFREAADSGLILKIDQLASKYEDDFLDLKTDIIKFDADLRVLGSDYLKLADAFHDFGHVRIPIDVTGSDSLSQMLQAMHDFSLL
jgi:hypothetical protein